MARHDAQLPVMLLKEERDRLLSPRAEAANPQLAVTAFGGPEALLSAAGRDSGLVLLAETAAGQTNRALLDLLDMAEGSPVALVSPAPSVQAAVEAMRLGVFDYLSGPVSPGELKRLAEQAAAYLNLRAEDESPKNGKGLSGIIGQSPTMQRLKSLIQKVAGADSTVLILGESGTGKELVARALHSLSPRGKGPLVPVNCGAIPHDLLESELFGHERGAFTGAVKTRLGRFELAAGGAIFLDEIGDMSTMLQVKLLRVLQEKAFERVGGGQTIQADIRIIAATNQDLSARVAEGSFREDLFYRLNVVPLNIPPLRERKEDIPLLCEHFTRLLTVTRGLSPKPLEPAAMQRLLAHDWPGNVRELENLLERMLILAEGDSIGPQDLPPRLGGEPGGALWAPSPPTPDGAEEVDFNALVDAYERKLILAALEQTGWVKNRAASMLKLNRTTLVEKIKKKKLAPPDKGGGR